MTEKRIVPDHVAIIMDGNGRWAKKRGLPRLSGHNAGMNSLKEIVKASSQIGIKYLTVYAFSTENWSRPEDEVKGIFKLLILYVEKELKELHENNVKVRILGDYKKLPKAVVKSLELSLETTKNNTGLQFNIALNYGGRIEIAKAIKSMCSDLHMGNISIDELNALENKSFEEYFKTFLYTSDIPDPDLVIRTSGELRLSNFLLWQTAYSELWFTDVLWPDFTREHLEEAVHEYSRRQRRYGGI